MHQGIHAIEGCGNPSHIWNVVEKDGEDNQKVSGRCGFNSSKTTPHLL